MNSQMKNGIGKKRIWLLAVLWIAALGLLFVVIYHNQKQTEIENFSSTNRQVIRQINNVMKQMDNLNEYLKSDGQLEILVTQRTLDPSQKWSAQISNYLNSRKNAAMNVEAVLLIMDNGNDFANVGATISPNDIRDSQWYQTYSSLETTRYYSPLVDQYGSTEGEARNYIMAAYPYKAGTVSGDMVFVFSFSSFRDALDEYDDMGIPVCIWGRDNQVLYTNREDADWNWTGETGFVRILEDLKSSYHSVNDTLQSTFVSDCTPIGGWKVTAMLSAGHVLDSMVSTYITAVVLFCVIYFCILAIVVSYQKIAKAEYAFLSAQINPHFIYKALNTIMFLCKRGEQDQAVQATKALEDILKDKLRVDEVLISDTLQRELEVIRQYLFIQKIYYHFPIELREDVEEGLLDLQIPKNILHPLVENALYHGILLNMDENGAMKDGVIRVSARREENELVLTVSDNGVGMSRDQVEQVFYSKMKRKRERGMHIGIENIKYRLRYLRELRCRLEVSSREGEGTDVTLRIEIRKKDK